MDKTHNSRFSEMQDEYLKTRDEKYLNRMYRLCVDIASNYIGKYAKGKGLNLDITELSHDSAVYVIEQYLKKPGFRIERISAYMHFGCIKSMYRNKEREQREVSFDDCLSNEESVYAVWVSQEEGRHEPALIKQGLLFKDSATGKEYEEIPV